MQKEKQTRVRASAEDTRAWWCWFGRKRQRAPARTDTHSKDSKGLGKGLFKEPGRVTSRLACFFAPCCFLMSTILTTTSRRSATADKIAENDTDTLGMDLEDKESRYIPTDLDSSRFAPSVKSTEAIYAPSPKYTRVDYLQCHWKRRREIVAAHPDLANIPHHDPMTGTFNEDELR